MCVCVFVKTFVSFICEMGKLDTDLVVRGLRREVWLVNRQLHKREKEIEKDKDKHTNRGQNNFGIPLVII